MRRRWLGPVIGLFLCSPATAQDPIPVGSQIQVNSYTTGLQSDSAVAMSPGGGFVVAWHSEGSFGDDSYYESVQVRRVAADGTPVGDDFQVNTDTIGFQVVPSVAPLPGGEFVVAWWEDDPFKLEYRIRGRRFLADGSPNGNPFQVSMYPGTLYSDVSFPDVASAPDGSFVVVWSGQGFGDDTSGASVEGQRFSSTGAPAGTQFQVNSYTTDGQRQAAAAVGPGGEFVVVWRSSGSSETDIWDSSIQGQRFAADGTPAGDEFQVNTYTPFRQDQPDLAVAPDGGFLVVWHSVGSGGSDNFNDGSIQARRFAANGDPLGDDFQVNTFTTDGQWFPAVAADGDGEFIVVWRSEGSSGSDTDESSIQGRRLASDGTPLGSDFQVNTYTTDFQIVPSVAAATDGRFVVSWSSNGSAENDSAYFSIQAQSFVPDCDGFGGDSDGDGVCDDFDLCLGDDATGDGDGDGVCADTDCDDGDPDASAIDACGVCGGDNSTCSIFADGFESGDTLAWTVTVP